MNHVIFDVMNTRVTFKNIPIHELSKFAFKDVGVACEEFKKILGVDECIIIQTASRIEIFTVIILKLLILLMPEELRPKL